MWRFLGALLEIVIILVWVNFFKRKKYKFQICDMVFLFVEMGIWVLMETVEPKWASVISLAGYIGIYWYDKAKFRCSHRQACKTIMRVILCCLLLRLFYAMINPGIYDGVPKSFVIVLLHIGVLMVSLITGVRGNFQSVLRENNGGTISLYKMTGVTAWVGMCYFFVFRGGKYQTDGLPCGVAALGALSLCFVYGRWQQDIEQKYQKERELELYSQYEETQKQLLQSIRGKQHDFHNQIMAVYSQHALTKDYDTLVTLQKKYCHEIREHCQYESLLNQDSPTIMAFLYAKMAEAKESGCQIKCHGGADWDSGVIPMYELVEIMGVLLDNAREAAKETDPAGIEVEITEGPDYIGIAVINDVNQETGMEISHIWQPGYTTKGNHQGIGLTKAMELLERYGATWSFAWEKPGRIAFTCEIPKESSTGRKGAC